MYASYTAKRSLVSGHVVGNTYDLALAPQQDVKRNVERLVEVQESLSGHIETNFYGLVVRWAVSLSPVLIGSAAYLNLREFLDSTADGTEFEFDPYGTVAVNSAFNTTVWREDKGYDESRVIPQGAGGATDYIQVAFTVRDTTTT